MAKSTLGNSVANTSGSVTFACPKCMDNAITRARNEREVAAKYVCDKCGFVGPN